MPKTFVAAAVVAIAAVAGGGLTDPAAASAPADPGAQAAPASLAVPAAHAQKRRQPLVVGYFAQWGIYARQYPVKSVETSGQAQWLTHLNYAFGDVDATGHCVSADPWADTQRPVPATESIDGVADVDGQPVAGNFNQLRKLKQRHPGLQVMMSLGGWTLSKNFSDASLTAQSRETLVRSCIETFLDAGIGDVFDGFDLDWEWPGSAANDGTVFRPQDKRNYTLLTAEFRRQLDALGQTRGKRYALSAFFPANAKTLDAGYEVRGLVKNLDHVTVQGYDLHGTWEKTTNHQSALFKPKGSPTTPDFSVSSSLKAVVDRGAPARKVVMGVPFYGQGWTGVEPARNGLFQTSTGPAPGVFAAGTEDYKTIAGLVAKGLTTVHRDHRAKFAWVFDGTTFWTFDDPWVMRAKATYVRRHGYGGVMMWALNGDDSQGTLTRTLSETLRR